MRLTYLTRVRRYLNKMTKSSQNKKKRKIKRKRNKKTFKVNMKSMMKRRKTQNLPGEKMRLSDFKLSLFLF